jgi:hypothetical protein
MRTWRDYANLLTPEQIAHCERCDANPIHPNGPEGHRVRMIVTVVAIFGALGPGKLI